MSNLVDIAAERGVLAGLAKYGSNLSIELSDIIDINCFSKEFNQIIYKCFNSILSNSSHIDIPSVLSASNQFGFSKVFESAQNLTFLKSLWEFPILEPNCLVLGKKLRKLQIARACQVKLKEAWESIGEMTGEESIDDIFSRIETPITEFTTELSTGLSSQPKLLFENAENYVNYLADNPINQMGFTSPWKLFDGMIGGGFRKQSITCIATRTSVGKSHLLKSIGLTSAKNGIKVLFLDTEMSMESTLHRSIASLTRVPINDIECGRFGLNSETKLHVLNKVKENEKLPFFYQSVAGKSFEEVLSICKRWVIKEVGKGEDGKYKDCMIILDYIKLMNIGALQNVAEYQLFGEYLHNLHDFSVRFDLPVITAVQTNRSGINDKEDLSTVSISDRISWLCSNMILMRELTPDEQAELNYKGNIKIVPMKTRFGTDLNGGDWLLFKREAQFSLLTEIGRHSEIKDSSEGFEDDGESTEF